MELAVDRPLVSEALQHSRYFKAGAPTPGGVPPGRYTACLSFQLLRWTPRQNVGVSEVGVGQNVTNLGKHKSKAVSGKSERRGS